MTYVVVGVDGNLYTRPKKPAQPRLQAEAGQPTLAIVNLRHLPAEKSSMCVVTAAHHPDITHPRNPVGAAVAATFGAEQHPYAGPVMFVGRTGPVIHDVPRAMRIAVAEVHAAVAVALAGAETAFGPVWAQAVRDYTRRVVEVAGPEWLDLEPVDLFGRDVTGRSWWECPGGGCGHPAMFHDGTVCRFAGCGCGKKD